MGLVLQPNPPHIAGPTWQTILNDETNDVFWNLPEYSLGWGVLDWLSEYVLQPSGPRAREPFEPTDEQARFILWWYAVDRTGKFIYRSGLLRRLKGWGKDPLAAALALAELCGPVDPVFDGLEVSGRRKGAAWVQIAAVSQDQTGNTFKLFPAMISQRLKADFGLEIHKTIIYTNDGGLIEGVTSSPAAMEGKRPTFVILNEVQWWVEANDGIAMAGVIQGNVDKAAYGSCRSLAICNAHVPGQDSIGERDYEAFRAVERGDAVDTGLLYDSIEAPAGTPVSEIPSIIEDPDGYKLGLEALREGLLVAVGDATWLDVDVIVRSILDVRNPVSESRRKFLNQVNASEDSWIPLTQWDQCYERGLTLQPKEKITLGFDGSKSNDCTALVACRVEDGGIFLLNLWNPNNYLSGEIPREDVDAAVHSAFERYKVVAFRADVREFESYVDEWGRKYKRRMIVNASPANPVAFDMRTQQRRFALDCEKFEDAVYEGELCHDGNAILRAHVGNAVRHPTNYDAISIRKATKDSSRKIDAAVCAVLAFAARQDVLMSKRNLSRKGGVLRV